jgi:hypothetical protein
MVESSNREILDIDLVINKEQFGEFLQDVTCVICLGIARVPSVECQTCNHPFCESCI